MTQATRQRVVAKTKKYRRRRNSNSGGAAAQRGRRERRKLYYELGTVLTEVRRLGEWDEANLPAIKRAICRLLNDYIAFVKTHSFDPIASDTMREFVEFLNSIDVRGDLWIGKIISCDEGSSLRVQGRRHQPIRNLARHGFIPAGAGATCRSWRGW